MSCWCSIEDDDRVFHGLDVSAQRVLVNGRRRKQASTYFMISAKLIASSTPGIAKARSCIMLPIIPFESAVKDFKSTTENGSIEMAVRTLLDHLLNSTRWVNLHREEVVKAVDFRRVLRELLTKCIGQVMCWICGLQVHSIRESLTIESDRTYNKQDRFPTRR